MLVFDSLQTKNKRVRGYLTSLIPVGMLTALAGPLMYAVTCLLVSHSSPCLGSGVGSVVASSTLVPFPRSVSGLFGLQLSAW